METKIPNVFSNADITVTYNPKTCIHAERCSRELSSVFRNSIIPWIDLDAAPTRQIINQINKCPSGALSFNSNQKKAC
ncbi:(4Fe-4S)-binding protein [Xanthomarina sp. F1114]|uniref:(4Fe-4S)-binding protein n=1 Tax=Xanthomarina sp. F1114 TaxID=2996019 RepID=UPI00225E4607|nr:(4Fe-4S)-binding protein [Xanthomarina sp. F1114]MCX7547652.1 (4Fe-4S)-binding protein [Xanthomarina sp. F1114]